MNIYDKIDYLLKLNNLKQIDMCKAINTPMSTYSSMKQRNSKSISIETVKNISEFFNVSVEYFLNNRIEKESYRNFVVVSSDNEIKELIQNYKALSIDFQGLVLSLINSLISIQDKNHKP